MISFSLAAAMSFTFPSKVFVNSWMFSFA